MAERSVANGRLVVPPHWPKWKLRCHAKLRSGQCGNWSVCGMPTCKYHGSGGEANRRLGQIRYLCWIICGGPQDMPVNVAARVALYVFAEAVLKQGKGSPKEQMAAALWLTGLLDDSSATT